MQLNVNKISSAHLKQIMDSKASNVLLLDFRSFLSYNSEHIKGAINVFCPSILKRRFATTGCLRLEAVVTPETRKKLRNGEFTTLVLYDNDDTVRDNSDLAIVLQGLNKDNYMFKTASILKGGFHTFHSRYPHYCVGQKNSRDSLARDSLVDLTLKLSPATPRVGLRIESQNVPTQLLPHLFIGDEKTACDYELLRNWGVGAILNVSTSCADREIPENFTYKCIPVRDNESENISAWFSEAFQFIESTRKTDGKVLVHCRAGISRSATICIAYLMVYKSLTLDQAFEYVRAKRNIVSPNLNFMQQLFEFERFLLVQRMCQVAYSPTSARERSPFTCAQINELSPSVVTNSFTFNVCAVSQI